MSILNVEHLSHGFGDRAIFEDVSFRLLKGEHIGLVGANGKVWGLQSFGFSAPYKKKRRISVSFILLIFRTAPEMR